MSVYLDSSAFLKLYLEESNSEAAADLLGADDEWVTARHSQVEVRRSLTRQLTGPALQAAREEFDRHWRSTAIVELTAEVCEAAADVAEVTGARTLDALHLGAARAVEGGVMPIVTFDLRLARAGRALGWTILGVC
ncbi:MAG: type II toxin-antitoxin system VapC family toxin [Gemmatimonadaceae bacterium]